MVSPGAAEAMRTAFIEALSKRMVSPGAVEAMRIAFSEAMCEEATSDLLCWGLEEGLGQGDAHAEHMASSSCARMSILSGLLAWQMTLGSTHGHLPSDL